MPQPPIPRRESLLTLAGCAALSLLAIAWSWHHHALLNYGDAVAHLHIARRVFDSRIPRFSELGSVWLPLPHILMIPFVQVYSWWAYGIAGIIPFAAFGIATLGLSQTASLFAEQGLAAYGAYDLTNLAVVRGWSGPLALADWAWGGIAATVAGAAGYAATWGRR